MYSDDSGFAVDSPRRYGYSTNGHRCYGSHDWYTKGRKNVIGAVINNRFVASSIVESNVNADVFFSWTMDTLLPNIPPHCIVVLDNASFHKRADIKMAITENEHKWAQVKSIRKKERLSIDQLYKRHIMVN